MSEHGIYLTKLAVKDLTSLDRGTQVRVLKKILQLAQNPEIGQPLGNRSAGRLSGYRKLKLSKVGIRVIYSIHDDLDASDTDGALIIVIGARDDGWCYSEAQSRVEDLPDGHPLGTSLSELLEMMSGLPR